MQAQIPPTRAEAFQLSSDLANSSDSALVYCLAPSLASVDYARTLVNVFLASLANCRF